MVGKGKHIARYLISCALLCFALSSYARVFEAGERLYFKGTPSSAEWWMDHTSNPSDPDYTRLWAYFFNGSSNKWIEAHLYDEFSHIFYVEVTETNDWTHVILTRHKGGVNNPTFDGNCYNQTGDIELHEYLNYIYDFNKNVNWAIWGTYIPAPEGNPDPEAEIWGFAPEDKELCTSEVGKEYKLTPKDEDYSNNTLNSAWFEYNKASNTWTRLSDTDQWTQPPSRDYIFTLGEEGYDKFFFFQCSKPSACRLIRISINKKITSFVAVAAEANVTDSTCAVNGLVAFDDKEHAGDLKIWCEENENIYTIIDNSNLISPQTFKLKGIDAKATKTYTLHAQFFNGTTACEEETCSVTVSPPEAPIIIHDTITKFTCEEVKLIPDFTETQYFQWTNSINNDTITDDKNPTFDGQQEEMVMEYVFMATHEPPTPEGNLISNGTFEDPDKDELLESDYDEWGRGKTNFYTGDNEGKSGGYAITDNAKTFWKDYREVKARERDFFGLFDSKIITDGSTQAAWIARSGTKNPKLEVKAGVSYLFSFWVANINTYSQMDNGAILQFQISYDGGTNWEYLGKEINLKNFKDHNWHGRSSIATPTVSSKNVVIRVINLNKSNQNIGNDFALDDIRFEAVTANSSSIAAYERFPIKYVNWKIIGATFDQPLNCDPEKADVNYTVNFEHPRGDLYIYEGTTLLAKVDHNQLTSDTKHEGKLNQPEENKTHEITFYFKDDNSCSEDPESKTFFYDSHAKPEISIESLKWGDATCDDPTVTLTAVINYTNQNGTLTANVDGHATDPVTYEKEKDDQKQVILTFPGIPADGKTDHKLNVNFDGPHGCSISDYPITEAAPYMPNITSTTAEILPYKCEDENYKVKVTVKYTDSQDHDLIVTDEEDNEMTPKTAEYKEDEASLIFEMPWDEPGPKEHTFKAYFEGAEQCKDENTHLHKYTSHAKPSITATKFYTGMACDKTTYTLQLDLTYTNQKGSKFYASVDGGEKVEVANPNPGAQTEYKDVKLLIEGLPGDGKDDHTYSVWTDNNADCELKDIPFEAPFRPVISNIQVNPIQMGCNETKYDVVVTFDVENGQGKEVSVWCNDDDHIKTLPAKEGKNEVTFDGVSIDMDKDYVNIWFEDAINCKDTYQQDYTEPVTPHIEVSQGPAVDVTDCKKTTYTVKFDIAYINQRGKLFAWIDEDDANKKEFEYKENQPTEEKVTITFTGLTGDELEHTLHAEFDGENSCSLEISYDAPFAPVISEPIKVSDPSYDCSSDKYEVELTIDYTNGLGHDIYIKEGTSVLGQFTTESDDGSHTKTIPVKLDFGTTDHNLNVFFDGLETTCPHPVTVTAVAKPSLGTINNKYITACDKTTFDLEVEVKDFVNQDGVLSVSIDGQTVTMTPPEFIENSATPQTKTLKVEGLQADGDNTSHILSVAFVGGSHGCANNPTALTGIPHMPKISNVSNTPPEADNTTHTYKLTISVEFENPHGDLVVTDGDLLTKTISETDLTASPAVFEFSGFTFDGKAKEFNAYFTSADTCEHTFIVNEPNKTAIEDIGLHLQANCDQTTFTINGTITFERGSGNLSITDIESGKSLDINEGSWNSPQNFSISNIPADDKVHHILVKFDGPSGSQATKEYKALHSPAVNVTKGEPTYDCSSDKYEIELTIDYTNGLGHDIYIKEGTSVLGQFTTESDDGSHTKTIPVKLDFGTTDHNLNVFFDGLETTCPHPVTVTAVAKPSLGTINNKYITACDKTTFDLEVEVKDFVNQDGVLSVSIDGQTVTMTPPEFIENSATPQTKTLKVEGLQADGDNTSHILSVAFVGGSHGCANNPTALTGIPHMPKISNVSNTPPEADNTTHTYKLTISVEFENPHGDLVVTDGDLLTKTISETDLTASPAVFEFSGFTFDGKAKEFNAYFTSADTCEHTFIVNEPNKTAIEDIGLHLQANCDQTTFTINGTITFERGSGNLSITDIESGKSLDINEGSWNSPQNFSISNIPADGKLHHLLVQFDGLNGSQATKEYKALHSPVIHYVTQAFKPEVVSGETQYHITLSVTYSNALGKYIKVKEEETVIKSYTVSADAGTDDIQLDFDLGTNHSLKVYFDGREECAETVDINSPILPDPYMYITICPGESMVWCDETIYPTEDNNEFPCDIDESHTQTLIVEFYPIPSLDERTTDTTVLSKELPFEWEGDLYTLPGHYEKIKTTDAGDESCIYTVYLDLTVLKQTELISIDTTTCEGTPVDFYGKTYDTSGSYETDRISGQGTDPDTIYTLNLTVFPTYLDLEEEAYICEGGDTLWNGILCNEEKDYTAYLHTVHGCDSTVTLHLHFWPSYTDLEETAYIYEGGDTLWNGILCNEKKDYTAYLHTVHGCDSIVTLHLNIAEKLIEYLTVDTTTCEGTPVDFYGKTYDTSNSYKTDRISGQGADPDTIYTLNLTVFPTYLDLEEEAYICEGGDTLWNGILCNEEKDYTAYLHTVHGCDSTVTLHLHFWPSYTDLEETAYIYEGGDTLWNGILCNEEKDYTAYLHTVHGCDSTITLNLTVLDNIVENVSFNIAEQCAGEGALEIVLQHTGYLTDAQLTFSEDAIQAGFENGTYPIKNDTVIVPYNVKAGIFSVGIDLWFHSRLKYSGNAPFTLLFPSSVLEQGWMDAIFVLTHNYNGGYNFTAFQWYKKGQKLLGETGPYLYQPLEVGAEYSAMLTEQSGLQLMTCPIIIEEHTDISLYPTVVTRREMIRVSITQNARLTMYSLMGEKVSTYALLHGDTQIEAPGTQGIYLAEVVLESGTRKVIKIMVR